MQGNEGVETALTEHVQLVGVGDGAVLVLHHAGVVAPVRWHGALHHQAPLLVSQLGEGAEWWSYTGHIRSELRHVRTLFSPFTTQIQKQITPQSWNQPPPPIL